MSSIVSERKGKDNRGRAERENRKALLITIIVLLAMGLSTIGFIIYHQWKTRKDEEEAARIARYEADGFHDYSDYFSSGLDKNGYVKGVSLSDSVKLVDYRNIPDMGRDDLYDEKSEETKNETAVEYLLRFCEVQIPKDYLSLVVKRIHFRLETEYEYLSKQHQVAYGDTTVPTIWESYNMTESEYEQWIRDTAEEEVTLTMILLAIAKKENLTAERTDMKLWVLHNTAFSVDNLDELIYQHGEPCIRRNTLEYLALKKVVELNE